MPTAADIVTFRDDSAPLGVSPWLPGAVPQTAIRVVEADPAWPAAYARVERLVRDALGFRVLLLEHVGSTSVPGLPAKPIIDVDLVVADSADEGAYVPALEAAAFELRVREPWWYEHRMLGHLDPRCNLHVFGPDSPEPLRHWLFRDWLRTCAEDFAFYRDTKLAAAEAANERSEHTMQYNARKHAVVREIYRRVFLAAGLLEQ